MYVCMCKWVGIECGVVGRKEESVKAQSHMILERGNHTYQCQSLGWEEGAVHPGRGAPSKSAAWRGPGKTGWARAAQTRQPQPTTKQHKQATSLSSQSQILWSFHSFLFLINANSHSSTPLVSTVSMSSSPTPGESPPPPPPPPPPSFFTQHPRHLTLDSFGSPRLVQDWRMRERVRPHQPSTNKHVIFSTMQPLQHTTRCTLTHS